MQVIMLLILAICTLAVAKSVDNTNDDITSQWELTDNDGNEQEVAKATRMNRPVSKAINKAANENGWLYRKRQYKRTYNIQTCYSGDLYQTVKALGVLKNTDVKMAMVSGELYKLLLRNNSVRLTQQESEKYKADITALSSNDEIPRAVSSDTTISKRTGSSICQEDAGELVVLAHASGQYAYVAYDYGCTHSNCELPGDPPIPIGLCQKKIHTFVVYIIDGYGQFVPYSVEIGCGCQCILY